MINTQKSFKELFSFVDRAEKSRKYPTETAKSLRAALRLYEADLNEEESKSLEKFKENFKQITSSVFGKNANKFTSGSLATYQSRVQKVLSEYEKYGDPQKMNSWNPKVIIRGKKKKSEDESLGDRKEEDSSTLKGNTYNYKDSGNGWEIIIKSTNPITSAIKKQVIEISDLLERKD